MNKEKLSIEELEDLMDYSMAYLPFQNELSLKPKMTIKQFCIEVAQEMSYHRNLDEIEGIA